MGIVLHFPTSITEEESIFGFSIQRSPTGGYVAVAELRDGLFAVKARAIDGSIEYRVCNHQHAELYLTALTLDDLRARFEPHRKRPQGA